MKRFFGRVTTPESQQQYWPSSEPVSPLFSPSEVISQAGRAIPLNVEESECQRAYDLATELYVFSFDRFKDPEESALREAHEDAAQNSLAAFNRTAVGAGSTRQKYEKKLQTFLMEAFENIKRDAFRQADLLCSNAIKCMVKELKNAGNTPTANVDNVIQVLDGLVSKYESGCHGPEKWKKLAGFLRQSLEGPVRDLITKQIDQIGSERSSLALKCREIEDLMNLQTIQLEAVEQQKADYLKLYEDAISDKKKTADEVSATFAEKEEEIRAKALKLEEAEQRLTTLNSELKAAESKIRSYDNQIYSLKNDIKALGNRLESSVAAAQSFENEARILEQDKLHLEQKYQSEFAEKEAKRATKLADVARSVAVTAQKEKSEFQRETVDLMTEVEKSCNAETEARSKVAMLVSSVEEREKQIESLLKSNNEQRASTVHVLEGLLENERAERAHAVNKQEELSVQLQATQRKLDQAQQEVTAIRLNELLRNN